jgi:hypothetical protein
LARPGNAAKVWALDPRLTLESVEAMVADMRRRADSRLSALPADVAHGSAAPAPAADVAAVTVRLASPEDARGLDRLAQMDSGSPSAGPALVAEVDGELVAALPLGGGRALADPFRATSELVRLLELRAAQLDGDRRKRGRWLGRRLLRRRRALPARARP